MWVALSEGWLSIVAHRDKENYLLVRARNEKHIESYFPEAELYIDAGADYPYRADILRDDVADVIGNYAFNIEYDNYKNSVNKEHLHDSLVGVWQEMYKYGRTYRPNTTTLKDWMNDSSNSNDI